MTVDETGVDETVVDVTGVDKLGINQSVIPIYFGWFFKVPSPHALVFIQKTFL